MKEEVGKEITSLLFSQQLFVSIQVWKDVEGLNEGIEAR